MKSSPACRSHSAVSPSDRYPSGQDDAQSAARGEVGMAYYGVDGGWCFTSGAFVGHVKFMFIRGTDLKQEPPVTPIGMGRQTRGVELASVDELGEPHRLANWS